MLFRTKMDVGRYCEASLKALLSSEREPVWEALRAVCEDRALSSIERQTYYRHLRAIYVELVLIAITKTFGWTVSSDAHFCVMDYLGKHGLADISSLAGQYGQAFGSSSLDGVTAMVSFFDRELTQSNLSTGTAQRLVKEFYQILRDLFDKDFKSLKLTAKTRRSASLLSQK